MIDRKKEVHIICRLRAKPEYREELARLLNEYVEPARREAGCLYYDVFEDRNEPNAFFILDGWRDQAAVDAHIHHPNVERVNALVFPLLAEKLHLTEGRPIDKQICKENIQ